MAISVLTSVLVLFSVAYFSYFLASSTLSYLKDKIDISVYFKRETPEDRILDLKKSLETLPEIKKVEYISAAQALLSFKEKHAEDKTIAESLAELGENPLKPSLNIKAKEPEYYSKIASYLENSPLKDSIDKITYTQNRLVIERFTKIIKTAEKGAIILCLI